MDTVKKTFCRVTMLVVCLLLTVTLSSGAFADVTYTYTGNSFTTFAPGTTSPPYTNVSGSFTEATALAASKTYDLGFFGSTLSYTFTDGFHYWSNRNSWIQDFLLTTDAAGNIAAWAIDLDQGEYPAHGGFYAYLTTVGPASVFSPSTIDLSMGGSMYGWYAATSSNPGTWAGGDPPPSVPEPSTMIFLGSGLICLAGLRMKFKK